MKMLQIRYNSAQIMPFGLRLFFNNLQAIGKVIASSVIDNYQWLLYTRPIVITTNLKVLIRSRRLRTSKNIEGFYSLYIHSSLCLFNKFTLTFSNMSLPARRGQCGRQHSGKGDPYGFQSPEMPPALPRGMPLPPPCHRCKP